MVQSVRAFSAVIAVIAISLGHPVLAETSRGFPCVPGELAACRPSADGCQCSFTDIETILTFGEAAESVLLYYTHAQAADEYPLLMSHLLRQCLGQAVAPIVFPFVHGRTATAATPDLDQERPLASTGQWSQPARSGARATSRSAVGN
jgi:hypothetical protein